MDVAFALSVIFTGVTIVFIVLIVLILVMVLIGKVFGEKAPKNKQNSGSGTPVQAAPVQAQKPAAPQMAVQDGIGQEVIAVIAAAIAAFTGGKGKILSVKRAPSRERGNGRNPWSMAGLMENTQPF